VRKIAALELRKHQRELARTADRRDRICEWALALQRTRLSLAAATTAGILLGARKELCVAWSG
jgi:hypothetical protein